MRCDSFTYDVVVANLVGNVDVLVHHLLSPAASLTWSPHSSGFC